MKQLSIIIPAYNMEAYLPQCVESILRAPSRMGLDVIIVNDGSRDKTLQIAKQYADRFSSTIRVVDKENGNYGSAINAGLEVAEGEYVKILDADDTFYGSGIAELLTSLRKVQGVDMIVTPFIEVGKHSERRVEYNIYSRKVYKYDQIYDADTIFADGVIRFFMMHGVCYRTALLREMAYKQSEGISYTDQEWVFYPLFKVKTIAFSNTPIYRYNTAREGQTMDMNVQMRSLSHLVTVTEALARYYIAEANAIESPARKRFLQNILADRIKIVYRKYLLAMPNKAFANSNFVEVDRLFTDLIEKCEIGLLTVLVNNMLKVDLLARWRKTGKRFDSFRRILLLWLDRFMAWCHALIFRRKK